MRFVEVLEDERLLGQLLLPSPETWKNWMIYAKVRDGDPLTDPEEIKVARERTGRTIFPASGFRESYIRAGRRSGKSYFNMLEAVYLGAFREWGRYLKHGEKGYIFLIASDKYQARVLKEYVSGFLHSTAILKKMIRRETTWDIELRNGIIYSVHTASFRTLRGFSVVGAFLDEIAFWRTEESANPDKEIINALRPALATIPESVLRGFSTPYGNFGYFRDVDRKYYGKDESDVLIWTASSEIMNPTLDRKMIERAFEDDPASARAEYGAEFRSDLESFVSSEIVQALVIPNRFELPVMTHFKYVGFCDPSGGRNDSMTCAVAHSEKDGKIVLDAIREKVPPFSPERVVKEFAELFGSYGIKFIKSDRYAGEWISEAFKKQGIFVEPSELSASELYGELLPVLMTGNVELLESKRLVSQLSSLERRVRVGGKDLISHPVGLHDDLANSVAGAIVHSRKGSKKRSFLGKPIEGFFDSGDRRLSDDRFNPCSSVFNPSELSEDEADELFSHGVRFFATRKK